MRSCRADTTQLSFLPIAIAAAALPCAAHCASGSGVDGSKARLDLRIVVPEAVHVSRLAQQNRMTVDAVDVRRGYVDVEPPIPALVTSNARNGYAVTISFDTAIASRVVVRIDGQQLSADRPGAEFTVAASRMRDAPVAIAYRIFLAPTITAGSYRWPVALRYGFRRWLP